MKGARRILAKARGVALPSSQSEIPVSEVISHDVKLVTVRIMWIKGIFFSADPKNSVTACSLNFCAILCRINCSFSIPMMRRCWFR